MSGDATVGSRIDESVDPNVMRDFCPLWIYVDDSAATCELFNIGGGWYKDGSTYYFAVTIVVNISGASGAGAAFKESFGSKPACRPSWSAHDIPLVWYQVPSAGYCDYSAATLTVTT